MGGKQLWSLADTGTWLHILLFTAHGSVEIRHSLCHITGDTSKILVSIVMSQGLSFILCLTFFCTRSGIGYETVRALAGAGARVLLTSRSMARGQLVADKLNAEGLRVLDASCCLNAALLGVCLQYVSLRNCNISRYV